VQQIPWLPGGFSNREKRTKGQAKSWTFLTEIQIIEKTDTPVETVQINQVSQGGGSGDATITQTQTRMENALKYRMRAVSRANQVNMEWEDCTLAFHKEIVNVLSNIM
jgi:hypothetical protein